MTPHFLKIINLKIKIMKKLLTFLLVALMIVSCRQHPRGGVNTSHYKQELPPKFKKGDVVYLKPDSLKVVIRGMCPCEKHKYTILYHDKDLHEVIKDVEEELIFSK